MTITIKKRGPGDYYVKENDDISIYNPSVACWGDDDSNNLWYVAVAGDTHGNYSGEPDKTKRAAVEYAEWVYNELKKKA